MERQEAILEALLGVLENSEEVLVAAKTMLESTDVSRVHVCRHVGD